MNPQFDLIIKKKKNQLNDSLNDIDEDFKDSLSFVQNPIVLPGTSYISINKIPKIKVPTKKNIISDDSKSDITSSEPSIRLDKIKENSLSFSNKNSSRSKSLSEILKEINRKKRQVFELIQVFDNETEPDSFIDSNFNHTKTSNTEMINCS
ncbi:unnamed protein product [Brachionus calyciflorus]|uniref:Uncharacterized protein n=1 Tax=Brachionus calyciflorus TaxID=104777 RepID=A0A814QBK2_9BILA|nr:unnamed protein product [Brachionus calyciflorus]